MKATRTYRLLMLILALVTAAVLVMTVLHIRSASVFEGPVTAILLLITAVVTGVCLCIEQPKGNRLYKCGFYILHGGLVILLCGFLLSRFLTVTYNLSFPVGGGSYSTVRTEDGSMADLGLSIGVSETKTEYYTDADGRETKEPKHYEATVTLTEAGERVPQTVRLTVNHPLRAHGARNYKIYLMSFGTDPSTGESAANLLIKSDPAEYTILAGIGLLLVGSILMCLLAPVLRFRQKSDGTGDPLPEGAEKPQNAHTKAHKGAKNAKEGQK